MTLHSLFVPYPN